MMETSFHRQRLLSYIYLIYILLHPPTRPCPRLPLLAHAPNFSYFAAYSTGYWMVSANSLFTSSKPPTSSQVTSGTSTWVSRRADGLQTLMACRKCSLSIINESKILASISSSSMSMSLGNHRARRRKDAFASVPLSSRSHPCPAYPTASAYPNKAFHRLPITPCRSLPSLHPPPSLTPFFPGCTARPPPCTIG